MSDALLEALQPSNYSELARWAERVAKTDFVPQGYRNRPDNIIVAVQYGLELGLTIMQSLQGVAVVNGRPTLYGDAMLAVCQKHPSCEDINETPELNEHGHIVAYICTVRRTGKSPVMRRFSIENAKTAGLWGKTGPWSQYPARMLQMRARAFALRDAF